MAKKQILETTEEESVYLPEGNRPYDPNDPWDAQIIADVTGRPYRRRTRTQRIYMPSPSSTLREGTVPRLSLDKALAALAFSTYLPPEPEEDEESLPFKISRSGSVPSGDSEAAKTAKAFQQNLGSIPLEEQQKLLKEIEGEYRGLKPDDSGASRFFKSLWHGLEKGFDELAGTALTLPFDLLGISNPLASTGATLERRTRGRARASNVLISIESDDEVRQAADYLSIALGLTPQAKNYLQSAIQAYRQVTGSKTLFMPRFQGFLTQIGGFVSTKEKPYEGPGDATAEMLGSLLPSLASIFIFKGMAGAALSRFAPSLAAAASSTALPAILGGNLFQAGTLAIGGAATQFIFDWYEPWRTPSERIGRGIVGGLTTPIGGGTLGNVVKDGIWKYLGKNVAIDAFSGFVGGAATEGVSAVLGEEEYRPQMGQVLLSGAAGGLLSAGVGLTVGHVPSVIMERISLRKGAGEFKSASLDAVESFVDRVRKADPEFDTTAGTLADEFIKGVRERIGGLDTKNPDILWKKVRQAVRESYTETIGNNPDAAERFTNQVALLTHSNYIGKMNANNPELRSILRGVEVLSREGTEPMSLFRVDVGDNVTLQTALASSVRDITPKGQEAVVAREVSKDLVNFLSLSNPRVKEDGAVVGAVKKTVEAAVIMLSRGAQNFGTPEAHLLVSKELLDRYGNVLRGRVAPMVASVLGVGVEYHGVDTATGVLLDWDDAKMTGLYHARNTLAPVDSTIEPTSLVSALERNIATLESLHGRTLKPSEADELKGATEFLDTVSRQLNGTLYIDSSGNLSVWVHRDYNPGGEYEIERYRELGDALRSYTKIRGTPTPFTYDVGAQFLTYPVELRRLFAPPKDADDRAAAETVYELLHKYAADAISEYSNDTTRSVESIAEALINKFKEKLDEYNLFDIVKQVTDSISAGGPGLGWFGALINGDVQAVVNFLRGPKALIDSIRADYKRRIENAQKYHGRVPGKLEPPAIRTDADAVAYLQSITEDIEKRFAEFLQSNGIYDAITPAIWRKEINKAIEEIRTDLLLQYPVVWLRMYEQGEALPPPREIIEYSKKMLKAAGSDWEGSPISMVTPEVINLQTLTGLDVSGGSELANLRANVRIVHVGDRHTAVLNTDKGEISIDYYTVPKLSTMARIREVLDGLAEYNVPNDAVSRFFNAIFLAFTDGEGTSTIVANPQNIYHAMLQFTENNIGQRFHWLWSLAHGFIERAKAINGGTLPQDFEKQFHDTFTKNWKDWVAFVAGHETIDWNDLVENSRIPSYVATRVYKFWESIKNVELVPGQKVTLGDIISRQAIDRILKYADYSLVPEDAGQYPIANVFLTELLRASMGSGERIFINERLYNSLYIAQPDAPERLGTLFQSVIGRLAPQDAMKALDAAARLDETINMYWHRRGLADIVDKKIDIDDFKVEKFYATLRSRNVDPLGNPLPRPFTESTEIITPEGKSIGNKPGYAYVQQTAIVKPVANPDYHPYRDVIPNSNFKVEAINPKEFNKELRANPYDTVREVLQLTPIITDNGYILGNLKGYYVRNIIDEQLRTSLYALTADLYKLAKLARLGDYSVPEDTTLTDVIIVPTKNISLASVEDAHAIAAYKNPIAIAEKALAKLGLPKWMLDVAIAAHLPEKMRKWKTYKAWGEAAAKHGWATQQYLQWLRRSVGTDVVQLYREGGIEALQDTWGRWVKIIRQYEKSGVPSSLVDAIVTGKLEHKGFLKFLQSIESPLAEEVPPDAFDELVRLYRKFKYASDRNKIQKLKDELKKHKEDLLRESNVILQAQERALKNKMVQEAQQIAQEYKKLQQQLGQIVEQLGSEVEAGRQQADEEVLGKDAAAVQQEARKQKKAKETKQKQPQNKKAEKQRKSALAEELEKLEAKVEEIERATAEEAPPPEEPEQAKPLVGVEKTVIELPSESINVEIEGLPEEIRSLAEESLVRNAKRGRRKKAPIEEAPQEQTPAEQTAEQPPAVEETPPKKGRKKKQKKVEEQQQEVAAEEPVAGKTEEPVAGETFAEDLGEVPPELRNVIDKRLYGEESAGDIDFDLFFHPATVVGVALSVLDDAGLLGDDEDDDAVYAAFPILLAAALPLRKKRFSTLRALKRLHSIAKMRIEEARAEGGTPEAIAAIVGPDVNKEAISEQAEQLWRILTPEVEKSELAKVGAVVDEVLSQRGWTEKAESLAESIAPEYRQDIIEPLRQVLSDETLASKFFAELESQDMDITREFLAAESKAVLNTLAKMERAPGGLQAAFFSKEASEGSFFNSKNYSQLRQEVFGVLPNEVFTSSGLIAESWDVIAHRDAFESAAAYAFLSKMSPEQREKVRAFFEALGYDGDELDIPDNALVNLVFTDIFCQWKGPQMRLLEYMALSEPDAVFARHIISLVYDSAHLIFGTPRELEAAEIVSHVIDALTARYGEVDSEVRVPDIPSRLFHAAISGSAAFERELGIFLSQRAHSIDVPPRTEITEVEEVPITSKSAEVSRKQVEEEPVAGEKPVTAAPEDVPTISAEPAIRPTEDKKPEPDGEWIATVSKLRTYVDAIVERMYGGDARWNIMSRRYPAAILRTLDGLFKKYEQAFKRYINARAGVERETIGIDELNKKVQQALPGAVIGRAEEYPIAIVWKTSSTERPIVGSIEQLNSILAGTGYKIDKTFLQDIKWLEKTINENAKLWAKAKEKSSKVVREGEVKGDTDSQQVEQRGEGVGKGETSAYEYYEENIRWAHDLIQKKLRAIPLAREFSTETREQVRSELVAIRAAIDYILSLPWADEIADAVVYLRNKKLNLKKKGVASLLRSSAEEFRKYLAEAGIPEDVAQKLEQYINDDTLRQTLVHMLSSQRYVTSTLLKDYGNLDVKMLAQPGNRYMRNGISPAQYRMAKALQSQLYAKLSNPEINEAEALRISNALAELDSTIKAYEQGEPGAAFPDHRFAPIMDYVDSIERYFAGIEKEVAELAYSLRMRHSEFTDDEAHNIINKGWQHIYEEILGNPEYANTARQLLADIERRGTAEPLKAYLRNYWSIQAREATNRKARTERLEAAQPEEAGEGKIAYKAGEDEDDVGTELISDMPSPDELVDEHVIAQQAAFRKQLENMGLTEADALFAPLVSLQGEEFDEAALSSLRRLGEIGVIRQKEAELRAQVVRDGGADAEVSAEPVVIPSPLKEFLANRNMTIEDAIELLEKEDPTPDEVATRRSLKGALTKTAEVASNRLLAALPLAGEFKFRKNALVQLTTDLYKVVRSALKALDTELSAYRTSIQSTPGMVRMRSWLGFLDKVLDTIAQRVETFRISNLVKSEEGDTLSPILKAVAEEMNAKLRRELRELLPIEALERINNIPSEYAQYLQERLLQMPEQAGVLRLSNSVRRILRSIGGLSVDDIGKASQDVVYEYPNIVEYGERISSLITSTLIDEIIGVRPTAQTFTSLRRRIRETNWVEKVNAIIEDIKARQKKKFTPITYRLLTPVGDITVGIPEMVDVALKSRAGGDSAFSELTKHWVWKLGETLEKAHTGISVTLSNALRAKAHVFFPYLTARLTTFDPKEARAIIDAYAKSERLVHYQYNIDKDAYEITILRRIRGEEEIGGRTVFSVDKLLTTLNLRGDESNDKYVAQFLHAYGIGLTDGTPNVPSSVEDIVRRVSSTTGFDIKIDDENPDAIAKPLFDALVANYSRRLANGILGAAASNTLSLPQEEIAQRIAKIAAEKETIVSGLRVFGDIVDANLANWVTAVSSFIPELLRPSGKVRGAEKRLAPLVVLTPKTLPLLNDEVELRTVLAHSVGKVYIAMRNLVKSIIESIQDQIASIEQVQRDPDTTLELRSELADMYLSRMIGEKFERESSMYTRQRISKTLLSQEGQKWAAAATAGFQTVLGRLLYHHEILSPELNRLLTSLAEDILRTGHLSLAGITRYLEEIGTSLQYEGGKDKNIKEKAAQLISTIQERIGQLFKLPEGVSISSGLVLNAVSPRRLWEDIVIRHYLRTIASSENVSKKDFAQLEKVIEQAYRADPKTMVREFGNPGELPIEYIIGRALWYHAFPRHAFKNVLVITQPIVETFTELYKKAGLTQSPLRKAGELAGVVLETAAEVFGAALKRNPLPLPPKPSQIKRYAGYPNDYNINKYLNAQDYMSWMNAWRVADVVGAQLTELHDALINKNENGKEVYNTLERILFPIEHYPEFSKEVLQKGSLTEYYLPGGEERLTGAGEGFLIFRFYNAAYHYVKELSEYLLNKENYPQGTANFPAELLDISSDKVQAALRNMERYDEDAFTLQLYSANKGETPAEIISTYFDLLSRDDIEPFALFDEMMNEEKGVEVAGGQQTDSQQLGDLKSQSTKWQDWRQGVDVVVKYAHNPTDPLEAYVRAKLAQRIFSDFGPRGPLSPSTPPQEFHPEYYGSNAFLYWKKLRQPGAIEDIIYRIDREKTNPVLRDTIDKWEADINLQQRIRQAAMELVQLPDFLSTEEVSPSDVDAHIARIVNGVVEKVAPNYSKDLEKLSQQVYTIREAPLPPDEKRKLYEIVAPKIINVLKRGGGPSTTKIAGAAMLLALDAYASPAEGEQQQQDDWKSYLHIALATAAVGGAAYALKKGKLPLTMPKTFRMSTFQSTVAGTLGGVIALNLLADEEDKVFGVDRKLLLSGLIGYGFFRAARLHGKERKSAIVRSVTQGASDAAVLQKVLNPGSIHRNVLLAKETKEIIEGKRDYKPSHLARIVADSYVSNPNSHRFLRELEEFLYLEQGTLDSGERLARTIDLIAKGTIRSTPLAQGGLTGTNPLLSAITQHGMLADIAAKQNERYSFSLEVLTGKIRFKSIEEVGNAVAAGEHLFLSLANTTSSTSELYENAIRSSLFDANTPIPASLPISIAYSVAMRQYGSNANQVFQAWLGQSKSARNKQLALIARFAIDLDKRATELLTLNTPIETVAAIMRSQEEQFLNSVEGTHPGITLTYYAYRATMDMASAIQLRSVASYILSPDKIQTANSIGQLLKENAQRKEELEKAAQRAAEKVEESDEVTAKIYLGQKAMFEQMAKDIEERTNQAMEVLAMLDSSIKRRYIQRWHRARGVHRVRWKEIEAGKEREYMRSFETRKEAQKFYEELARKNIGLVRESIKLDPATPEEALSGVSSTDDYIESILPGVMAAAPSTKKEAAAYSQRYTDERVYNLIAGITNAMQALANETDKTRRNSILATIRAYVSDLLEESKLSDTARESIREAANALAVGDAAPLFEVLQRENLTGMLFGFQRVLRTGADPMKMRKDVRGYDADLQTDADYIDFAISSVATMIHRAGSLYAKSYKLQVYDKALRYLAALGLQDTDIAQKINEAALRLRVPALNPLTIGNSERISTMIRFMTSVGALAFNVISATRNYIEAGLSNVTAAVYKRLVGRTPSMLYSLLGTGLFDKHGRVTDPLLRQLDEYAASIGLYSQGRYSAIHEYLTKRGKRETISELGFGLQAIAEYEANRRTFLLAAREQLMNGEVRPDAYNEIFLNGLEAIYRSQGFLQPEGQSMFEYKLNQVPFLNVLLTLMTTTIRLTSQTVADAVALQKISGAATMQRLLPMIARFGAYAGVYFLATALLRGVRPTIILGDLANVVENATAFLTDWDETESSLTKETPGMRLRRVTTQLLTDMGLSGKQAETLLTMFEQGWMTALTNYAFNTSSNLSSIMQTVAATKGRTIANIIEKSKKGTLSAGELASLSTQIISPVLSRIVRSAQQLASGYYMVGNAPTGLPFTPHDIIPFIAFGTPYSIISDNQLFRNGVPVFSGVAERRAFIEKILNIPGLQVKKGVNVMSEPWIVGALLDEDYARKLWYRIIDNYYAVWNENPGAIKRSLTDQLYAMYEQFHRQTVLRGGTPDRSLEQARQSFERSVDQVLLAKAILYTLYQDPAFARISQQHLGTSQAARSTLFSFPGLINTRDPQAIDKYLETIVGKKFLRFLRRKYVPGYDKLPPQEVLEIQGYDTGDFEQQVQALQDEE